MGTERICVIGLGYIGLPTASLFATKGYKVLGVDAKASVVDTINQGKIHIYEPDLDVLVKSAVNSGNLKASTVPAESDVFIISVPTPVRDGTKPDVSYVEAATKAIAPFVQHGNLVILESTVPVGTTELCGEILKKLRPDLKIPGWSRGTSEKGSSEPQVFLAHCPERVLPGHILRELIDNDRIIGGIDRVSTMKVKTLYGQLVKGKIFPTDSRTAEMCKLTENSYRDVNIAFANELSFICDKFKINVWELIKLANRHPRVEILTPGPGVGGHCIAVDPWFIVHSAPEEARLIRTAREVNDSKPRYVIKKVSEKASRLKDPVIACLGLAFKANVDDLRESPAMEIAHHIAAEKLGRMLIVEPHVKNLPDGLAGFPHVQLTDLDTAVSQADLIVLLVNHDQFADVDREVLKEKIVIDTRGMWS